MPRWEAAALPPQPAPEALTGRWPAAAPALHGQAAPAATPPGAMNASPAHLALDARARALLAQLTSAEKLALLSGDTPFWSGMAAIALADASHRHPWPAGRLPRLGLAGLHFVDGPRGVVLAGGATTFPVPIARGASWNPELEERIGAAIAGEARSFGANWVAAVCVNLLRHPGWGRAQETYGEDPLHVGALGAAMTRGLQRHAVACVKHFALNSIDSSRFLVDVQADARVLHELYLPQFRDCIEAGAGSVMSAYNRVNGRWCGEHPGLLTGVLKRRWGFQGFVATDFIFGVRDGVAALLAGQDLEMPFPLLFQDCLAEALAAGRLPPARLVRHREHACGPRLPEARRSPPRPAGRRAARRPLSAARGAGRRAAQPAIRSAIRTARRTSVTKTAQKPIAKAPMAIGAAFHASDPGERQATDGSSGSWCTVTRAFTGLASSTAWIASGDHQCIRKSSRAPTCREPPASYS